MFKQIITLFRGRSYEAAEAVVDRNALAILRQQIRDCAEAISAARKAVAVAIAAAVNGCGDSTVPRETSHGALVSDTATRFGRTRMEMSCGIRMGRLYEISAVGA